MQARAIYRPASGTAMNYPLVVRVAAHTPHAALEAALGRGWYRAGPTLVLRLADRDGALRLSGVCARFARYVDLRAHCYIDIHFSSPASSRSVRRDC